MITPTPPTIPKPINNAGTDKRTYLSLLTPEHTAQFAKIEAELNVDSNKKCQDITNAIKEFKDKNPSLKYTETIDKNQLDIYRKNLSEDFNKFYYDRTKNYGIVWKKNDIKTAVQEDFKLPEGENDEEPASGNKITLYDNIITYGKDIALPQHTIDQFLKDLALDFTRNVPGVKLITASMGSAKSIYDLYAKAKSAYKQRTNEKLNKFATDVYVGIQDCIFEERKNNVKKEGQKAVSKLVNLASNFIPAGQVISMGTTMANAFVSLDLLMHQYNDLETLNKGIANNTLKFNEGIAQYPILAGVLLNEKKILDSKGILGISKETEEIAEFKSECGFELLNIKKHMADSANEVYEELVNDIHGIYYDDLKLKYFELIKSYPYHYQFKKEGVALWDEDTHPENSKWQKFKNLFKCSSNKVHITSEDD